MNSLESGSLTPPWAERRVTMVNTEAIQQIPRGEAVEEYVPRLTKKRFLELTELGIQIAELAMSKGVSRRESCIVREVAERFFNQL